MSQDQESEMIEIVLGLLEKSKQQDESIQKAIKALEDEQKCLEGFRSDLNRNLIGELGDKAKIALKEPTEALKVQANNIAAITAQLLEVSNSLSLRNAVWCWGGFIALVAITVGFVFWYIPSFDDIASRRAKLSALNAQIEKLDEIKRLEISRCDKRLCVKVVENQCNWGKKGERYCIADIKKR